MQSTSSQENFEEKLLFFENYYNLWNIFWIQSNIFSDSCLKTFNRFVETAFHVSRRNFQNLLGKVFDCFVVFGSRTKISVISDFWTNHFGNVVKRPSRVHRKRSGKNVFFSEEFIFCLPFSLNGSLWVCEQKLLHGCQISIIYGRRILWRKSRFRETVSFWSISVNKCSEGMTNLHPQVQKKFEEKIWLSETSSFFAAIRNHTIKFWTFDESFRQGYQNRILESTRRVCGKIFSSRKSCFLTYQNASYKIRDSSETYR